MDIATVSSSKNATLSTRAKQESAPGTSPTYTLTAASKLSEDYIHSSAILASSTAVSPLASFLNSSGQSEALLIHNSGELCHLMREPLSSTGWNTVGIGAQVDTIIAANSNNLAILGHDESIWISNAGHWNPLGSLPGGNPALSACQDGTIYGTCDQGGQYMLYQYDPVQVAFIEVGAIPYSAPPVGSAGNLWTLDDGGNVLSNTSNPLDPSGPWMPANAGLNEGDTPEAIFISSDGTAWILCNTMAVYVQDSSGAYVWDLCSTPAGLHAIAPVNANAFYALCTTSGTTTLYSCDGDGNNTEVPQPVGKTLVSISVGSMDGNLWGLDSVGSVWRSLNNVWVRMIQPTDLIGATGGHHVTEVVTGRHALGAQYAFYVMDGNLYWSLFQEEVGVYGGYWTPPIPIPIQNSSGISNVGLVNDPVTNSNLIVYGVNSGGEFVVIQDVKGTWTATTHKMSVSLSGIQPIFNTYDSYWVVYAIINGTFHAAVGQLNAPETTLTAVSDSPSQLHSLIPIATNAKGIDWVLASVAIDNQGQLWVVQVTGNNKSSFEFKFVQLSGQAIGSTIGSVRNAVAMLASETDGARIYATDENDSLWIIRQIGYSNGMFAWSEWHPLGDECVVLGTGCSMPVPTAQGQLPPVDLFSLDSGYEVNVLSEDATTGRLTDVVMLKPAGSNMNAEYVSRYLTEVTVADANSVPQPNFIVSVTADSAVGIWVGPTLYTITPDNPVTLTTDPRGKLTFAFFATDLNTPTFSFSADTLVSSASVYPAQNVHDYLSGSNTAVPGRPAFDSGGQTLTGAQMQTVPTWDGGGTPFIQGANTAANAGAAAQAITNAFQIPTSTSGNTGQWSVASSDSDLVGGSSFWTEMCKFPHDIEHAIRKAVLAVTQVSVDVGNKVMHVTMQLANGLSQALTLIINTVEDVVSAVKTAFRFVERGVDEAIHWLKSLFNWSDILNTKMVIEAALNGMMTKMEANLDPKSTQYAGTFFANVAANLTSNVTNAFDNAKSIFEPSVSFSQSANSQTYPPAATPIGTNALNPSSLNGAQSANGVHTNYVHTHATNYTMQGGTLPQFTNGDGSTGKGLLEPLNSIITTNTGTPQFQNDHSSFGSKVQGAFSSMESFFDTVIVDLINAAEDVVLDTIKFINELVQKLLSMGGNALAGFQKLLNKNIDIPVISWIWKQISKHDLTILDLLSLLLAVPSTLLYKLTFGLPGAKAPFTDEEAAQIVSTLSNPDTYPWPTLGTSVTTVAASPIPPDVISSMQKILIPTSALVYSVADIGNDSVAWQKLQGVPVPQWLPDLSVLFKTFAGMLFRFAITPSLVLEGKPLTTEAEKWTVGYWASGQIPITAALVVQACVGGGVVTIPGVGLWVACCLGYLSAGTGLVTDMQLSELGNPSPFLLIRNFIAPLPGTAKPYLLTQGEPEAAVAMAGVGAVDAICDLASGALTLAADLT
jgi:hypothetical protein